MSLGPNDGTEKSVGLSGGGRREEISIRADSAGAVTGELSKLEPTQQAGLYLASGVGVVITAAMILIVVSWLAKSPWLGVPPGLSQMPPEKAKLFIDNLKTLNDLATDSAVKMFDTVVARSLLPVFTAILGYIFGTRANSKQNA